jgi:hypothetical protein
MSALQRGSSHDPVKARELRLRQAQRIMAQEKERAERVRKEQLREVGRRLDAAVAADRAEARKKGITVAELRQARELGIDLTPSKPKVSLREQGRILDQIESCYKQHKPAQQYVTLDDLDKLYEQGVVEWQGDTLVMGVS